MNLKKIAVVLPGSINRGSRARRSIKEMSKYCQVDVFYIPTNKQDQKIQGAYNENVHFHIMKNHNNNIYYKILQNSFFYYRFSYFTKTILKKNIKYNLIYIHDLVSGHVGICLKKKLGSLLIYDVHDLYIETLNQAFPKNEYGKMKIKHYLTLKVMQYLGKKFESKLIKKSDHIFTVNQSCQDYLKLNYKSQKVSFFRNFPEFRKMPKNNYLIHKLVNVSVEKNISIYIGSLATGRHLINIVKSAKYLEKNNIIVIIGNGVLKKKLIEISRINNTLNSKIYFLDIINYDDLFKTIIGAKIGIMLLDPINKSKEFALANKISEYMLCGVVPLLSNHLEHINLDDNDNFSYKINEINPKTIAKKINTILMDNSLVDQKSKNARIAYEVNYNWEKERGKFLSIFKKLLSL